MTSTTETEDRETMIRRLEAMGTIDPKCPGCAEHYQSIRDKGSLPFAPSHRPSERCKSGKYPHCTCDTCF